MILRCLMAAAACAALAFAADSPKPTLTLTSPKANDAVEQENTFAATAKAAGDAVPVAFVRPLGAKSDAWVQPKPTLAADGAVTGTYHCGDANHGANEKFRLTLVLLAKEEAEKFKDGDTVATLPKGLASAEVEVKRGN